MRLLVIFIASASLAQEVFLGSITNIEFYRMVEGVNVSHRPTNEIQRMNPVFWIAADSIVRTNWHKFTTNDMWLPDLGLRNNSNYCFSVSSLSYYYLTNGINGRPVIFVARPEGGVQTTNSLVWRRPAIHQFTVFVPMRSTTDSIGINLSPFFLRWAGGWAQIQTNNTMSGYTTVGGLKQWTLNHNYLVEAVHNAANGYIRLYTNGVLHWSTNFPAYTNILRNVKSGLLYASVGGGSNYYAEAICFDYELPPEKRAFLTNYLSVKYGIPQN